MVFRYIAIDEEWNRDEQKNIQSESVDDYAERIKVIKNAGNVMCYDGLVRDVLDVEYVPSVDGKMAYIDVFLSRE